MQPPFTAYRGDDPFVFVSYSHRDTNLVFSELGKLNDRGFNLWFDEGIAPGESWRDELANRIDECSLFLLFVTPNSVGSEHCLRETNFASNRAKPIIAVHLAATELPAGLELTIGDRQAIIKPQLSEVDYLKKLCSAFEVHVGRRPERPTDNATAFGLYTQGIERLARFNKWDTATAVEMLDHATSLDPEFADAWAHLGEACWNHTVFFASDVEFVDRADAAVEKALELDPGNIVARTVYARMLWSPGKGYQTRDALRTLDGVLRVRADAHQASVWQATIFVHVGLAREARWRLQSVVDAVPDDSFARFLFGHTHSYLGEHSKAVEEHSRALSMDPTNQLISLHYPSTCLFADELNAAEDAILAARKIGGDDPMLTGSEALLWAKRGERERAKEAARRTLQELQIKNSHVHTHHVFHNVGSAFAMVGETDLAIDQIRQAAELGLPNFPLFDNDHHLASLNTEPKFVKLLEELKDEFEQYREEFGEPDPRTHDSSGD